MRIVRFAMAASLSAGLVGYATGAVAGGSNPRLEGGFFVDDPHDPIDHNEAFIDIFGSDIIARGEIESHAGTATAGVPDTVFIQYRTDEPNHINVGDHTAHVHQHEYSELRIVINSDTPARNLDTGPIYPQKCEVDADINTKGLNGKINTVCSGNDIFSELTADQVASILAAFSNTKDIKINVNSKNGKASLKIKTLGPVVPEPS